MSVCVPSIAPQEERENDEQLEFTAEELDSISNNPPTRRDNKKTPSQKRKDRLRKIEVWTRLCKLCSVLISLIHTMYLCRISTRLSPNNTGWKLVLVISNLANAVDHIQAILAFTTGSNWRFLNICIVHLYVLSNSCFLFKILKYHMQISNLFVLLLVHRCTCICIFNVNLFLVGFFYYNRRGKRKRKKSNNSKVKNSSGTVYIQLNLSMHVHVAIAHD